jgi:hypothetical protein
VRRRRTAISRKIDLDRHQILCDRRKWRITLCYSVITVIQTSSLHNVAYRHLTAASCIRCENSRLAKNGLSALVVPHITLRHALHKVARAGASVLAGVSFNHLMHDSIVR